jgi:hypothetical protein
MAFNYTSYGSTEVPVVGVQPKIYFGVGTLSSGTLDVTVKQLKTVIVAVCASQDANAVRVSATSGNTFTATGTGTGVFGWVAIGV